MACWKKREKKKSAFLKIQRSLPPEEEKVADLSFFSASLSLSLRHHLPPDSFSPSCLSSPRPPFPHKSLARNLDSASGIQGSREMEQQQQQQQALAAAGAAAAAAAAGGAHRQAQTLPPPPAPPPPCCPLCDPRSSKHIHLAYDLKKATPVFKGR